MPMIYSKLSDMLKTKGITEYQLKKDKVAGGATLDKLFKRASGHISTQIIERLCDYLDCQPGDIMEYIQDEKTEE